MNYYKDDAGQIYYYNDLQIMQGLHEGKTPLTEEELGEHLRPKEEEEKVERVSQRQIRLLLIEMGMDEMVEEAIEAIPDGKSRKKARVEWEYASYIDRRNPLIAAISEGLGLTEEQIDEFFLQASRIGGGDGDSQGA